MRWEQLFSDLDARFDDLADADMMAELADRQRVAAGAITVVERVGGALGRPVRIRTTAGMTVAGTLRKVGPDWVLLQEAPGREVVLALRAATIVEGLSAATGPAVKGVGLRLNLRHALRGLARDRSPIAMVVGGGVGDSAGPYTEVTGTIDRLGADFLELAVHAPWEPRRAASVRSVVLIPLPAVVLVRAVPLG
ncbi:hypothetical protein SAMN04515671_0381 [Nakamurella panacisegetis]|uniref:Uncharacterized protein n=1 Tax=Nakamurella panacisegetis TaxID=1090615 RepID=A0A1H0I6E3_9ACTN|nr:hypothetical protein [Nakamurella panacisegetis]SDO26999.1 hypothetical protein SAMN04515671_0381 [Nakamurella panacisegetis]